MLVEIKMLDIRNEGHKRNISLNKMYINSSSVVSIVDYDGVNSFLIREESRYSREKFSLVKINEGGKSREIIAFGSAEQLFSQINETAPGKRLLHD